MPGQVSGRSAPAGRHSGASPAPGTPDGEQRSRRRIRLDLVRSPYALWVAVLSVAVFCAPNLLVLAAGSGSVGSAGQPTEAELILGLVITLVLQLVVFSLALLPLLAAGRPFSRLWGPTKGTPAMVAIGLAVGVVTVLIAYTINALVIVVLGDGEPVEQELMDSVLSGGTAAVLGVLIAVVVAPFTEEVIFRGVLFRALADRIGMFGGAILSALVFAVIHIEVVFSQPLALTGLFVIGVLLAIAYHLTGSIVVPIIGHAVFNATSLALATLVDRLDPLALQAMTWLLAT